MLPPCITVYLNPLLTGVSVKSPPMFKPFVINSSEPLNIPYGTANFTSDRLSLGVLDVANQTAVHWTLFDSIDHSVIDEVWLTKSS